MNFRNRYEKKMRELNAEPMWSGDDVRPIHLSEASLLEIEQNLGVSLPPDFREFMQDFGFFGMPPVTFPLKPNADGVELGIFSWFSGFVSPTSNYAGNILKNYCHSCETMEGIWSPDWLPIGFDSGSGTLAYAFKGKEQGHVYYFAHPNEIYHSADTFEEFIQSLECYDAEEAADVDTAEFWNNFDTIYLVI